MPESLVIEVLKWVLSIIGTGVITVSAFVVKGASSKIDSLDNVIHHHSERLLHIEATYICREDLDSVINILSQDVQKSFDRAHSRIDEIYRSPRKD